MRKTLLAAGVIVAATPASAARNGDGGDPPEPSDPPEGPVERPPRSEPETKPETLPVLYGRETALSLCTWGAAGEETSFHRFIWDEEDQGPGAWTCRSYGVPGDDTCTFGGADEKPTDARYRLVPRDQADHYVADLVWPDGSALYGIWAIACATSGASGGSEDVVEGSGVGGRAGPELAYVSGGVVEHVRPALVRGSVTIALPPEHMPRQENDLVLAIEILGASGWETFASRAYTVETTLMTFELEAVVPELVDVRLAVRANAARAPMPYSYDVRDARVFVETCIPDQNRPGMCLGD